MASQESESQQVAHYFETHAVDFDSIYEEQDKGAVRTLRDKLSRGTVVQRLDYVRELAARAKPERVLDVGCGAGRFAIPLAMAGADVVGLDFAHEMVAIADRRAQEQGVADHCSFLAEDYLAWEAPERFDLTIATGVLDYVSDAHPLMAKMAADTRGLLLVSFPKLVHPLVPLRKIRLSMEGCPVFFYSQSAVRDLGEQYLKGGYRIRPLGRDYLLIGRS